MTITGFNIYKYVNDFYDSLNELSLWCTSGKLQPYENVIEGFENMPRALIDQLDGKSQGKAILRVWQETKLNSVYIHSAQLHNELKCGKKSI